MDCQGPCLEHCVNKTVFVLAYGALAYVMACVGYVLVTRGVGSPFKASLTPAQRAIKDESTRVRSRIFWAFFSVSVVVLVVVRPLKTDG